MTNEQTLGGEGVRLNIDIRARNVPQEARLSNVGVAANDQSPGVGVDRRQTTKMLAHLLEVEERVLQALADSGHATQGSALELLALEKRLAILQQTHVVARDSLDQVLGGGDLAQGNAEVVGIVESIEQILVEGVDVLELGEALEDGLDFLGESLAGVLDFARVEGCARGLSVHWILQKGAVGGVPRILVILKPALI